MEGFSRLMLSKLSIDELVPLVQADPSDTSRPMNELISRFTDRAKKIAVNVCRNYGDRDDVMNAALLVIVSAVRTYRPDSTKTGFSAYGAVSMLHAARRESQILAAQRTIANAIGAVEKTEAKRLEEDAEVVEREALPFGWLTDAVVHLPKAERDVLNLTEVGYKGREIAIALGVQAPAVSKRLASAHRMIRDYAEAAA